MATTYTVADFTPVDSPTFTTPVQVTGHTVHNLTVARTPTGQAIFGWVSDSIFYVAVEPDFDKVYQDDVVPDGNEREVFNLVNENWFAIVGSVWVDRGDLFCAIQLYFDATATQQTGYSKCFIADDPENPVVWTERGLIDSQVGNGSIINVDSGGPVTVLESGRWVLPFPMWGLHAGGFADLSGIATSDDRGIDWTVRYGHRRAPGSSGTTGPIADTIGQDPLTGYLYWSHYDGPGANEAFILESQDEGVTWTLVESNAPGVWNFCIDNSTDKLYAAFGTPGVEWEFWDAIDPGNPFASFVDLNLTVIPSSLTNTNFQAHVFLDHGSIAFVDERRIAGYFFEPGGCVIPNILWIPYKDRLLKLQHNDNGTPDVKSWNVMAEHDFDNLKVIERWAGRWMTEALSDDSCELFIPHKDHVRIANDGKLTPATQRAIADMSFQNYKTIERWAHRITGGECACEGPSKCQLRIPFKDCIGQIRVNDNGVIDRNSLIRAASQDFENYKTIERWANDYARGTCTGGLGFPPEPFPDPPTASARIAGELMEVSIQAASSARLTGELMEVSTQVASDARLAGIIMEVAVKV